MHNNGIVIKDIKKIYNNNVVLNIDEMTFELGSIYGLIGTNGVGKTTLLEILMGTLKPNQGTVLHNGLAIEMIYHDSGLFQELTVYENMFQNREIYKQIMGLKSIDWSEIKKKTVEILKEFGLELDINLYGKELNFSTQKLLEIVIAISKNPDVIIIDEPLTLLDIEEIKYLNSIIEGFIGSNRLVIFSSHRLGELFQVVDKVITMRNGKIASIQETSEGLVNGLIEFDENDVHKYPKRPIRIGEPILKVKGLITKHINDIDFTLSRGEILGIIGLKGSYKSEIGKALFGALPSQGHIYVESSEKRIRSTKQAVEAGICYLGSANEGMFVDDSVVNNVVSANVPRARKLSRSAKRLISKYYLDMLNISNDQIDESLSNMSAGNKQKVLLAKWFFSKSKVFIFNKPTANIDVPSKVDIYNIFSDLLESGAGIIMISNDLEEVAGICDRVLVIQGGKIRNELNRESLSVHKLVEVIQNW